MRKISRLYECIPSSEQRVHFSIWKNAKALRRFQFNVFIFTYAETEVGQLKSNMLAQGGEVVGKSFAIQLLARAL